jgi:hypothetical protein
MASTNRCPDACLTGTNRGFVRRWLQHQHLASLDIPLTRLDGWAVRWRLLSALSRLPEPWLSLPSSWAYQWIAPNHDDWYEERWSRAPLSVFRLATFAWFVKLRMRGEYAWLLLEHPEHPLYEELQRLTRYAPERPVPTAVGEWHDELPF